MPDEQSAKEFAAEASRCEARGEPWVPPPDRVAPLARRPLVDLAVEWLEEVKRTASRLRMIESYGSLPNRTAQ